MQVHFFKFLKYSTLLSCRLSKVVDSSDLRFRVGGEELVLVQQLAFRRQLRVIWNLCEVVERSDSSAEGQERCVRLLRTQPPHQSILLAKGKLHF